MVWCLIIQRLPRNSIRINTFYELKLFNHQLKLSAVRKVPETIMFQVLGSFETLGSKLSHGTSLKFADVRTHLRKVSKMNLSSIWKEAQWASFFMLLLFLLQTLLQNFFHPTLTRCLLILFVCEWIEPSHCHLDFLFEVYP